MATDVHKPISTNYTPNPTSPATTPPSTDHQRNNNQTIPTTTTNNQAVIIPPGFSAPNQDDFQNMTEEQHDEKCYNDFDNIDDDDKVIEILHDMFNYDGEFTTITTTEDKEANDLKPGLTPNPTPQPTNDPQLITKNQVMPMIIEDESNHDEFTTSNDYYDNIDHEILRNTIDDDDYQAISILPGMFDIDTTIETVLATSATTVTSDSPIKTQTMKRIRIGINWRIKEWS